MADSEKTEKATPKRRRDERKKGNIFFSNDAVSVAVLLVGLAVLFLTIGSAAGVIGHFMRQCIAQTQVQQTTPDIGDLEKLLVQGLWTLVQAGGILMGATVVVGIAVTLFQTKMLISGESIKPKFSKLNPLQGIKRLFSLRSLIEALKGLLKIVILLYLLYNFLSGVVDTFTKYLFTDLSAACSDLLNQAFQMSIQIGIAYIVLAAADTFYQWWDYERQIRMSKQEIKEEFKQMEGDPQIKGKIKEAQRKIAQSRMMQQVPQADVVIRNPTHFAVALRYKPDRDRAPLVLAKGQDEVALRIVKTAEEHGVAVVENVPLARSLYASTELGQEIPPDFYNAVAEVLVYLYQINGGGS